MGNVLLYSETFERGLGVYQFGDGSWVAGEGHIGLGCAQLDGTEFTSEQLTAAPVSNRYFVQPGDIVRFWYRIFDADVISGGGGLRLELDFGGLGGEYGPEIPYSGISVADTGWLEYTYVPTNVGNELWGVRISLGTTGQTEAVYAYIDDISWESACPVTISDSFRTGTPWTGLTNVYGQASTHSPDNLWCGQRGYFTSIVTQVGATYYTEVVIQSTSIYDVQQVRVGYSSEEAAYPSVDSIIEVYKSADAVSWTLWSEAQLTKDGCDVLALSNAVDELNDQYIQVRLRLEGASSNVRAHLWAIEIQYCDNLLTIYQTDALFGSAVSLNDFMASAYVVDMYLALAEITEIATSGRTLQRNVATAGQWLSSDVGSAFEAADEVAGPLALAALTTDWAIASYYDGGSAAYMILSLDTSGSAPVVVDSDTSLAPAYGVIGLARKSDTEVVAVYFSGYGSISGALITIDGAGAITIGTPVVIKTGSDGEPVANALCVRPFGADFVVAYVVNHVGLLTLFDNTFAELDTHITVCDEFNSACHDVLSEGSSGVWYVGHDSVTSEVRVGYVPVAASAFGTEETAVLTSVANRKSAGIASFTDDHAVAVWPEAATGLVYGRVTRQNGAVLVCCSEPLVTTALIYSTDYSQYYSLISAQNGNNAFLLSDHSSGPLRTLFEQNIIPPPAPILKFYYDTDALTERATLDITNIEPGAMLVRSDGTVLVGSGNATDGVVCEFGVEADNYTTWTDVTDNLDAGPVTSIREV